MAEPITVFVGLDVHKDSRPARVATSCTASTATRSAVRCNRLFCRSSFQRGHVEHDLAYHSSLSEQLVRVPRLGEGESLRDERSDPLLLEEAKQGDQVLSKPSRFESLERLDAVGDHALAARQKPAADNVQSEGGHSTKALTAPRTT